MKKTVTLFFILFEMLMNTAAQDVWTLHRCIDFAKANNLQIKQSSLNEQVAKATNQQAKLAYTPSLTVDGTQYFNFGRTLNVTSNSFENSPSIKSNTFTLSSSMPLFAGFAKHYQVEQSKYDFLAAHNDLLKTTNDVALNIALYYYNILNAWQQFKIMQLQKKLTALQHAQTEKLITAGVLSEISIADVEATLATDELNIVNAKNNLDVAYLHLKQLLNLDVNQTLTIDTSTQNLETSIPELDFNKIFSIAQSQQPSLLYGKMKMQSALATLHYYKSTMLPTLNLFGTLRSSYSNSKTLLEDANGRIYVGTLKFEDQINKNYGRSIGLDLNYPIVNGFQSSSAMKKSNLQVLNAKLNLEIADKQLQQDVAQAILNVKGAAAKLDATRAVALATKTAYDANAKKYDAGIINNFDFNTSKNNYAKALSDLANAQFDYLFKLKLVEFYEGKWQ